MTTLAEHTIVSSAENRPLMLDKTMYNSWQSPMLLYIKGKKNGRMMVESIENGPLVYPTIEENGQIRNNKYAELTEQKSCKMTVMSKQLTLFFKESGLELDEEQLAFLADPEILYGQAIQTTNTQNAAYQTNDLDAYDSDYDDISSAKVVLMANLSSYDSEVLSE
nr:hypothetical protein [Tanacetum cinerariifolium]